MDGAALAAKIRAGLREDVAELGEIGLATILVGEDHASQIYIRLKHDAAEAAGMRAVDKRFPEETSQEELEELVRELNEDDSIDGILVQTPLPPHIDEPQVMRTIAPMKDVDGLHPFNAGQLYFGTPTLAPATPLGIMRLLEEYRVPVAGARAAFLTPVPGGVGPMTIAMLLHNAVRAARFRRGLLAFPGLAL